MKKYVKPVCQLVELRPEENIAKRHRCHTSWVNNSNYGVGSGRGDGRCIGCYKTFGS